MKTFPNAALLLLFVLAGGLASFWLTRSQAIATWQGENPVWMENVPDQIIQDEETFCQWVDEFRQSLKQHRLELSRLIENPESEDEAILTQSDLIADTHAELLRGIGSHLKSMRSTLPDAQKKLLLGFCSQSMRGSMRQMGRRMQASDNMQKGFPGPRNGFRRRRGQGLCGLIRRLQLTDEQMVISEQKDPEFETDVQLLQNQLCSERQALFALLEDLQALNGQVPEQIEHLITAHNLLEKRLISYVVIMRPYLSPEQIQDLTRMCKNNCADSQLPQYD